jgi:hypothetical protein
MVVSDETSDASSYKVGTSFKNNTSRALAHVHTFVLAAVVSRVVDA